MMKSPSGATVTDGKSVARKVLGVTRDGVQIPEPISPASHFTSREIRQAINMVRAAQKEG